MQTNAIKQLVNGFNVLKFRNTDFQNFPLYFSKYPLYNVRGLGGHFPLEFRALLYVFGISEGRRMGKHTELNLIPTFNFFAPPYCTCLKNWGLYGLRETELDQPVSRVKWEVYPSWGKR